MERNELQLIQSEPLKVNTSAFEDLKKQIDEFTKKWSEPRLFFTQQFTQKLRCIVYYQLNHRNFDSFYWYCYNAARQYLQNIVNPIDKEGKPVNVNNELKIWIEYYKKEYPNLLPESQALVAAQFNKDYVSYQKQSR